MRQLKDMIMIHPADIRITTTAGFTAHFQRGEDGKPKRIRVPALAVPECMKHGAKPVAAIKGTETPRLRAPEKSGVKSEAYYPELDTEEIEEIDFDPSDLASKDDKRESLRNSSPYTETEVLVRTAIEAVLDTADPDNFTDSYMPKLPVLNQYVSNMTIKAEHRDRVWAKMEKNGEITDAMLNDIFGEDDDTDEAA